MPTAVATQRPSSDDPELDVGGEADDRVISLATRMPPQHADDPADERHGRRLDEELRMRSPRRAPSALRTPISRVRSVTETSMMFMMTMPPTTSEMAASETKTAKKLGADALPDADEGLVGIDGEAVFLARPVMADGAQDDAHLVGRRAPADRRRRTRARVDGEAAVRAVGVEKGGERDGDPVVLALAQGLALALAHADDGVVLAVDADLFAQRVLRRPSDCRRCRGR